MSEFLVGLTFGAFLGLGAMVAMWSNEKSLCAQENNVYKCEWVAVPVAANEKNQ